MYCNECNGKDGQHSAICNSREKVKPKFDPCPCGIHRGDCYIHKPEPPKYVPYEYGAYDSAEPYDPCSYKTIMPCDRAYWEKFGPDGYWRKLHPQAPRPGDFVVAPDGKWWPMKTLQTFDAGAWFATWGPL